MTKSCRSNKASTILFYCQIERQHLCAFEKNLIALHSSGRRKVLVFFPPSFDVPFKYPFFIFIEPGIIFLNSMNLKTLFTTKFLNLPVPLRLIICQVPSCFTGKRMIFYQGLFYELLNLTQFYSTTKYFTYFMEILLKDLFF